MERKFIEANDLLLDSFQLAVKVFQSGFKPDFLVGLWRGGSAVGIAVQEGLDHFGVSTDHIGIRTSYSGQADYTNMIDKADSIRVHGLEYLLENLCNEHSLLIVDDVYSSGSSVNAVINTLSRKARKNLPHDIRIASVWYRPNEQTLRAPDYFVRQTRDWLNLPYELSGLSVDELRTHKPALNGLIDRLQPFITARDDKPTA
ncbi:MAG: hypoxanthine phosphoribosyltransferase [Gammaproteobacteria bacterium]|jgi:hypoxanthine phosphoribosyltransferase